METLLQKLRPVIADLLRACEKLLQNVKPFLIAHSSKMTKYAVIISVVFVGGIWVHKTFEKITHHDVYYPLPVQLTVHDTVQVNNYVKVMLKDTAQPSPSLIEKIYEKIIVPESVITYVPYSIADSTAIASLYLISSLDYDGADLSINAFNPATRTAKHFAFDMPNDNFLVGTNSSEVWVLEHKQFLSWDGLYFGARYNYKGQLYPVLKSGLTFFHKLSLAGGVGPNDFSADLTWKFF